LRDEPDPESNQDSVPAITRAGAWRDSPTVGHVAGKDGAGTGDNYQPTGVIKNLGPPSIRARESLLQDWVWPLQLADDCTLAGERGDGTQSRPTPNTGTTGV